ncbi:MAG: hypothetical protein ACTSU5_06430 [Promethearchaeota archaeon]
MMLGQDYCLPGLGEGELLERLHDERLGEAPEERVDGVWWGWKRRSLSPPNLRGRRPSRSEKHGVACRLRCSAAWWMEHRLDRAFATTRVYSSSECTRGRNFVTRSTRLAKNWARFSCQRDPRVSAGSLNGERFPALPPKKRHASSGEGVNC